MAENSNSVKAKIFIVPLLIAVMIGVVIWLIVPDFSALQAERGKLKVEEEKLALMEKKNEKAGQLSLELQNSTEQKNILQKFVPSARQEEEMMNSLYTLASAEGLAVLNLSFIPGNDKASAPQMALADLTASDGTTADGGAVIAPVKAVPADFQISIGVLGGYDKIRAYLNKTASLKRYNNIDSAKIVKVVGAEDIPASGGNLQADLIFNFKYLVPNDMAGINAESSIFSSGKFDMDIVAGIRNKMNTEILGVIVDSASRANPFLP